MRLLRKLALRVKISKSGRCLSKNLLTTGGYSYNNERYKRFVPERAKKATCPLPEKCPVKIIWVRPVHDYRRFGHHIAKHTEEWTNLYSRRTAIERVNSRLKYHRRLDYHCFRGLEKIRLHCSLAILSLLGGALAKAQTYGADQVRVCVRVLN